LKGVDLRSESAKFSTMNERTLPAKDLSVARAGQRITRRAPTAAEVRETMLRQMTDAVRATLSQGDEPQYSGRLGRHTGQ